MFLSWIFVDDILMDKKKWEDFQIINIHLTLIYLE